MQADLNVIARQEHGAVGPEGRAFLFRIGKRGAHRRNVHVNSEAKRIQHQLVFYESIAFAHRKVLMLAT